VKTRTPRRLPPWLRQRVPASDTFHDTVACIERLGLNTVCRSARCPNIGVCFSKGTATFMILGPVCTRTCAFCAVTKGLPAPLEDDEPARIAQAVASMGLTHAVLTSVTRDDLPDGGAAHFAACVRSLRSSVPHVTVELLVPDFGGSRDALRAVTETAPDVLNHNIETVPRLYPRVRPQAGYDRSLALLAAAARSGLLTKSGLMLGLGETREETLQVMADLRNNHCAILTMGQYLPPTEEHFPLQRVLAPDEFDAYRDDALRMGFRAAACAPLVRSSYMAARLFTEAREARGRSQNLKILSDLHIPEHHDNHHPRELRTDFPAEKQ